MNECASESRPLRADEVKMFRSSLLIAWMMFRPFWLQELKNCTALECEYWSVWMQELHLEEFGAQI